MAPSGSGTIAQVCTLEYCHPANGNKGQKQDDPGKSTSTAGKVAREKGKGTCEMLIELRRSLRAGLPIAPCGHLPPPASPEFYTERPVVWTAEWKLNGQTTENGSVTVQMPISLKYFPKLAQKDKVREWITICCLKEQPETSTVKMWRG